MRVLETLKAIRYRNYRLLRISACFTMACLLSKNEHVKLLESLANAFGLVAVWAALVLLLFGFASTLNAPDTEREVQRTGNMACLFALAGTVLVAICLWIGANR